MKIALLNLPIDNNYGGNLQRYALMTILQRMGHDVTHINLQSKAKLKWYIAPLVYFKRYIFKYLLRKPIQINQEYIINELYESRLDIVMPFYERYINHTDVCYNSSDIIKITKDKYDAYIVGSDQCWRKEMNNSIGWRMYLFSFINDDRIKKIAYGVSFGKDTCTYNDAEKKAFCKLYSKFTAVSVREKSGLLILKDMGCISPEPVQVLDPTLLLNKDDYLKLIRNENLPSPAKGKVFCYVLDRTEEIISFARTKAAELNTVAVFYGITEFEGLGIEMWLKSFYEALYIITDSYHGTIFSIIFNKMFRFCGNERRGNARIQSLFEVLGVTDDYVYEDVNDNICTRRKDSLSYLKNVLRDN